MRDLYKPDPTWREIIPSREKRVNGVAIMLPDGKVPAVGGNSTGRFEYPVHRSEVFDPDSGTWSYVAKQAIPRGCHSTAMLLPDGCFRPEC